MIIKHADDKSTTLALLQSLLKHPGANRDTPKRIEQEIRNIQAGIRGEEEAAYEMKVHYGESKNWIVIHDLRIEHGGLVAQIDHIIINRWMETWVCESKHFSEGVAINEQGEFTAFYGSKPYGLPSPIEQNNRHIVILKRWFNSGEVVLPTRLGFTLKPDLNSLILVSKKARISRPKKKIAEIETIIKNDMLFKTLDKHVDDSNNPLIMAKCIGQDTLEALGHAIAKGHRPITFDWHAKFGLAKNIQPITASEPPPPPVVTPKEVPKKPTVTQEPVVEKVSKLICYDCNATVPYNVAKFCWFNKPKFGGNVYCMECQKKH